MVDAGGNLRGDHRLGMEGDAQARRPCSIGRSLAPSPTVSASPMCRPRSTHSRSRVASLASLPRIGSSTAPARVPAVVLQRVGRIEVEAQRLAHHRREVGEAAGHQCAGRHHAASWWRPAWRRPACSGCAWRPRRACRPAGPSAARRARSSAAAKSSSPFMARAVMPAIFSRRPRKSASSSSISFSIMVDSMSATSSRLRRLAVGTTTASTPGSDIAFGRAVERDLARDARRQPVAACRPQPRLLHRISDARCTIVSSSAPIRTRVFFTLRL